MRIRLSAVNKYKATYKPIVFYLLAAVPILLPLLAPGYILVLDMVFAPHIPMPQEVINTYPFYALLHFLNLLIPAWVIQKLLLVSIFVGAGLGAFTLMRSLQPKSAGKADAAAWRYASYVAGVFYMYNPFVYTRLMAGQYLVLVGYVLLPFFVRVVWEFAKNPSLKMSLWVAGLATAIAITSVHTLVVAAVVASVIISVRCLSQEGRAQWKRLAGYGLAGVGLIALLNSFWLVPVTKGTSSLSTTALNFTKNDFTAFATVPGDLGTIGNLLALQGFWGDEKNLYLLPQDLYAWWLLPLILLWALAGVGVIWSWRYRRTLCAVFGISGMIGLILAAGTAGTIFAPLNQWFADHIPLYAGYREPQKAAVLIVLAYAYFAACGTFFLTQRWKQSRERWATVVACSLIILACTPLLLWGGRGQLRSQDYPQDWYIANQTLNKQKKASDKALFLPWHLYQPFTFSSGTVATPAEAFFDIPVISSDDPELDGASSYKKDEINKKIDQLLRGTANNQPNQNQALQARMPVQLVEQGITYVILSKNYDYKKYDFLNRTSGFTIIFDSPTLTLYRITSSF